MPLESHGNKIFLLFILIKSQEVPSKFGGLSIKLSTLTKYPINFKIHDYLRNVFNLQICFHMHI